ncbi:Integrator complex subunit 3 [Blomia tropicalis]|nr:Integrator complex subunit 3 [Blomia tropicalis]
MLGNINPNNINVITSGSNVVPGMGSSVIGTIPIPINSQNNLGSGNNGNYEQALSHLFNLNPIEFRDDFEEKMCRCYIHVQNLMFNKSEQQAHEELYKAAGLNTNSHEDITLGLIASILLDSNNAQRFYRDLTYLSRDGLYFFNYTLQQIISDHYFRLHEHSRKQLTWFLKELLRNQLPNVEHLYYNMFRNIMAGDVSPANISLTESLLNILVEYRSCYENNISLMSFALVNYLRLIVDHHNPTFRELRTKEINFCISLLKERFPDFIVIGRDLIRLLQQVCSIPEFDLFWKDLLTNPTIFGPKFNIVQVMKIRTPRRFIKLRIPVELEKKILFLTGHVRFGYHRRYQEWLQKQYFSTYESQMLRTDVIRFIVTHIHPTNETLASDIFPRWALIGWMLSVNNQIISSFAKLALFYDWFFFDERDQTNNQIMDIEPGMLVMHYSLKNYPVITSGLLDFITRYKTKTNVSNEFHPSLTAQVKQGITISFCKMAELRVVSYQQQQQQPTTSSISKTATSSTILLSSISPSTSTVTSVLSSVPVNIGVNSAGFSSGQMTAIGVGSSTNSINNSQDSVNTANFSDDEDDSNNVYSIHSTSPNKKLKKSNSFSNGSNRTIGTIDPNMIVNNSALKPIDPANLTNLPIGHESMFNNTTILGTPNGNIFANNNPNNINNDNMTNELTNNHQQQTHMGNNLINNLNSDSISKVCGIKTVSETDLVAQIENVQNVSMRPILNKLSKETNKHIRAQEMQKLTKLILEEDPEEFEEYYTSLIIIILAILEDDLSVRIFPFDYGNPSCMPAEKDLKESITGPLFTMFHALQASTTEEDQSTRKSKQLFMLLAAMGTNNYKVGYLLMYYLIVSKYMVGRMIIYRHYAKELNRELADSLLIDLRCCAFDDVFMFFYLLPEICTNLTTPSSGANSGLLKLIVQCADSSQIQMLIQLIVRGSFRFFRKEGVVSILSASLEWESTAQYHVWQILSAHNISADQVIPILSKLEHHAHSEALLNLMLFIRRETPTPNLIKSLFKREPRPGDSFTPSILIDWAQNHPDKLAELIGSFISTNISSPNKRNKRTLTSSSKTQTMVASNVERTLFHLEEMRKMSANLIFMQEYMVVVLDQLKQLCSSEQTIKYSNLLQYSTLPDDEKEKNSTSSTSNSANSINKKLSTTGTNKKSQALSKTRSGNSKSTNNNDSDTESESSDNDIRIIKTKSTIRKKRKLKSIGSDSD